jgi:hypothetical protein
VYYTNWAVLPFLNRKGLVLLPSLFFLGRLRKKNRAKANGLALFRWEAMKTVIKKKAIILPIC